MALIDDLKEARDNCATILKNMTASPKPSYSVDGQSVQWAAYQRTLLFSIDELTKRIEREEGPDQELTELYTGLHPSG